MISQSTWQGKRNTWTWPKTKLVIKMGIYNICRQGGRNLGKFSFLVLAALAHLSCASRLKEEGILKLEIVDTELRISHFEYQNFYIDTSLNYKAKVRYKLVNKSSNDILLYNFKRNAEFAPVEPGFFCDSLYGTAEKLIYLFRENGKQKMPAGGIPDSLNYKSPSVLQRQFEMAKTWFRNSRQIVRKGTEIEFTDLVDFEDYVLEKPDIYYLRILYIQNNPSWVVSEEELVKDSGSEDVYLFKGCLWSNTIKLIVE